MVLNGETITTGASNICPDCKKKLVLEVLHSIAGYYIGTRCNCGPYSRESDYYKTHQKAENCIKNECVW